MLQLSHDNEFFKLFSFPEHFINKIYIPIQVNIGLSAFYKLKYFGMTSYSMNRAGEHAATRKSELDSEWN